MSVVPVEFSTVARSLRRLAIALLRTFRAPEPGSPAHRDASDRTYDGDWGKPLFQYVHDASPYIMLLHDHLRALAAVVTADRVAMAHVTLSRSVLETAGFLYWFYDPAISADEKVRRHINLRLERNAVIATQQLMLDTVEPGRKLTEPPPSLEAVRASRHMVQAKWTEPKVTKAGYVKPGRIGQEAPSVMERLRGLQLIGETHSTAYSDHLYRLMSGVAHGEDYAVSPFLTPVGSEPDDGVGEGEISLHLGTLLAHTVPVVLALDKVVLRLAEYRGLDLTLWTEVWEDVFPVWSEYVLYMADKAALK